MLSEEERQRIDGYSVWREQQRYTDEQLWDRLSELFSREIEILKEIPFAYYFAYSGVPDYMYWRRIWWRLTLELEATAPVQEAIAWHLGQRGDPSISGWLAECEQFKRDNARNWLSAVWGIDQ